jgi:hypothetical protein
VFHAVDFLYREEGTPLATRRRGGEKNRARRAASKRRLYDPAAVNQINDDNYQGHNQQDVNQTSGDLKAESQ